MHALLAVPALRLLAESIPRIYDQLCNADYALIVDRVDLWTLAGEIARPLRQRGIRLGIAAFPTLAQVKELGYHLHPKKAVAVVREGNEEQAHVLDTLLSAIKERSQDGSSQWYGRLPRFYDVHSPPGCRDSLLTLVMDMVQYRISAPSSLAFGPEPKPALRARFGAPHSACA